MAWARVQSKSGKVVAGTTLTITLTSTPITGNKIIVIVSNATPTVAVTVKNGAGTAMTQGWTATNTGNVIGAMYFLDVPATPSSTVVLTTTGASADYGAVVMEVSGLLAGNTTAALDSTAGTKTGTASPTTSSTYSSTAANEFLVSGFSDFGNSAVMTAPSGYTLDTNSLNTDSNADAGFAYKNSTGGAETNSWTYTTSGNQWVIGMVAFKLAAGGPTLITGVDTGTLTDASQVAIPTTDTGTLTDTSQVLIPTVDAGTLSEQSQVLIPTTDTGTLTESPSAIADTTSTTDSATLTDASQVNIPTVDSAALTESPSTVAASDATTDAGTLSETSRVNIPTTDSATLTEQSLVGIPTTDAATLTEATSSIAGTETTTDAATLTETSLIGISTSDSGGLSESSAVVTSALGTSIFTTQVPTGPGSPITTDPPVNLGTDFTIDGSYPALFIRYYKADAGNDGQTIPLGIWDDTGTEIASTSYNQTASDAVGWIDAPLTPGTILTPSVTHYVVAGWFPSSYGFTANGLLAAIDNAPLHSTAGGGRYLYGASLAEPTNTSNTNYFLDVIIDTSGGPITVSGNDLGTLSEQSAIVASAATTDAAALTEQSAIAATDATTDTGTLSESSAVNTGSSIVGNDLATLTEQSAIADVSATTDSATLTEQSLIGQTDTDSATLSETSAVIAFTTVSDGDSATLDDESTDITISDLAAEGTLSETSSISSSGVTTDAATLGETSVVTTTVTTTDGATGAETSSIIVTLASTDAGALSEASSVNTGTSATANDAATLAETSTIIATLTTVDAMGLVSEVSAIISRLTAIDAATLNELSAVVRSGGFRDLTFDIMVGDDRWSITVGPDRWDIVVTPDRWDVRVDEQAP